MVNMGKKRICPKHRHVSNVIVYMLACFSAQSTPALKYSLTKVGGRYLCCMVIMEWFYNQSIWFHRTHSNDGQEQRQRKKFTTFMELVLLHTSVKHHTSLLLPFSSVASDCIQTKSGVVVKMPVLLFILMWVMHFGCNGDAEKQNLQQPCDEKVDTESTFGET